MRGRKSLRCRWSNFGKASLLISYEEFQALIRDRTPSLNDLRAEYDVLLARMQTPAAKQGMDIAFNAARAELGRAAVKAARKHR